MPSAKVTAGPGLHDAHGTVWDSRWNSVGVPWASDQAEHGDTRSLLRVCDFEPKAAGAFATPPATRRESALSGSQ